MFVDLEADGSDGLDGFRFDFEDDDGEFGWNLTADLDGRGEQELRRGVEAQIRDMAVGPRSNRVQGNKEVRSI